MTKMTKHKIKTAIYFILLAVIMLVALAFAGIEIYVWCTYIHVPIEQIPMWALWFMFRAG